MEEKLGARERINRRGGERGTCLWIQSRGQEGVREEHSPLMAAGACRQKADPPLLRRHPPLRPSSSSAGLPPLRPSFSSALLTCSLPSALCPLPSLFPSPAQQPGNSRDLDLGLQACAERISDGKRH
ncbi:hypothetical protein BRADI_5g03651v3 [Brachypodium distachyon]|uniref:Uncharacterized protein n=1 Tax=Brachypodium distachyon TaxID=15368 RepID=A0A0Q3E2C5_BRADI|nr:hypothetical protein BRADI_5g03651v3 [Brachypodium distachyon]